MEYSVFNFFKKNSKIVIAGIAFIVPVVACIIFALLQGEWLGNFYLPASQWNDELLYYKQVEGVIEYGRPLGYYGYNESTAQQYTFGAWSPVIMSVYILWGTLFGWSYVSPIVCNILLISIALACFAYKAKLEYKQMGLIAGVMILFVPISRFMISCMSDSQIIALFILYLAFYTSAVRENDVCKVAVADIIGMFVCSVFLTLMRPYFLLLFVVPSYYWYKKNKLSLIGSVFVVCTSVVAYGYIAGQFTAAYFTPLINTQWIKMILCNPMDGIKNALRIFVYGVFDIVKLSITGMVKGNMEGCLWSVFIILLLILLVLSFKKKEYIVWTGMMILMLGAITMFYDIPVGSRHLVPYIVAAIIVLCSSKYYKTVAGILVTIVLLFTSRIYVDEYNYCFPQYDAVYATQLADLREELDDKIIVDQSADTWDNTIVWLFYDETVFPWQQLYAIPEGMGINLCMPGYVRYVECKLKAKYIAVNTGEPMAKQFAESGVEIIAERNGVTIYKLH